MLTIRGTVHYQDDTRADFEGGIVALSLWEQYAQRKGLDADPQKAPMTWQLYIAFACLGAQAGGDGFDTWRNKVRHVELEVDDANPTQAGTSDA